MTTEATPDTPRLGLPAVDVAAALIGEFERLVDEFGLDGWSMSFNPRLTSLGGQCRWDKKRVEIAQWAIDQLPPLSVLLDIVRHEVAHALAPGAGHGRAWKDACLATGAVPERFYSDVLRPPARRGGYKWVAWCPTCNDVVDGWFGRPRRHRIVHAECDSRVRIMRSDELGDGMEARCDC